MNSQLSATSRNQIRNRMVKLAGTSIRNVDRQGKVRWAYVSSSASDRPSPVALAKAAVSIAQGNDPPLEYPGKT